MAVSLRRTASMFMSAGAATAHVQKQKLPRCRGACRNRAHSYHMGWFAPCSCVHLHAYNMLCGSANVMCGLSGLHTSAVRTNTTG
eukprot:361217-Chlamydomonas_euryale.AAC.1